MISASTLNSELINKIAQDFAQATSLAVVVVNIHGDEISELFNFTPFCQLMRQHPEHSGRCRMSDRCGGLEASKKDQLCIYRCHAGLTDFSIPLVIAGQGTIGLEILEQLPDVEQIVVPIGGGGLITGIALTMKTLKPSVKIYGVMPVGSAVYVESRRQGQLVTLDHCSSMADAVVRKTGEEYLYPYIEKYVDDIFTVTEDSIRQAVRTACLYGKLTLEGSGALALAALLEKKCPLSPGTVLICSGGNIDKAVLDLCMQA